MKKLPQLFYNKYDNILGSGTDTGGDSAAIEQTGGIGSVPWLNFTSYNKKSSNQGTFDKKNDSELKTREDDKKILGEQEEDTQYLYDKSNNDYTRTRIDPHWQESMGKNNYRGNLNNKSYAATLNLSRATDALNNMRHWDPGTTGRHTNSSFGSEQAQMGKSERWEPIETQETRQMRQNEKIEEQVRSRDAARQANVQDYALDLQKQMDNSNFALANMLHTSDVQIQTARRNAMQNANINMPLQTYLSQYLQYFNTELQMHAKDKALAKIIDVYVNQNAAVAQLAAQIYAANVTVPGGLSLAQAQLEKQIQQMFPGNPLASMEATEAMGGLVQWDTSGGLLK